MKIESMRIENFRSFKDESIVLDNYTCFVGPNGSGKSTIINALNVFFRQYKDSQTDLSKLIKDDFHHKNTDDDIKITITFRDLNQNAKEELSHYVRQDKLIITAIAKYNPAKEIAEVKQYGNRLGLDDFKLFFEEEKNKATAADLKKIFSGLREKYPDIKSGSTKPDMILNLHEYEENHPNECVLIPSEDEFYGFTKGANKLAPFIQWVFISASKDITEETKESNTSALGQLLSRTVRSKVNFDEKLTALRTHTKEQYQALLDVEQSVLQHISKSLQDRLRSWAHPNINAQVLWKQDSEKSIKIEEPLAYAIFGERDFDGELSRFGHGLQRSYMLALLQELVLIDDWNAPTLIMGIEEPEIYQHPPQARYLAETLIDLSEKGSQVFLSTHSPFFIPGDNFDKIRIVRECGKPSYTTVKSLTYEDLAIKLNQAGGKLLREEGMVAKLYPSLNLVTSEMFFCKVLILVEGYEDMAYITSYLLLTEKILDFRRYGCHIIPVGGKNNLIKPLAMAKLLNIPAFVVFDADTDKDKIPDQEKRDSEVSKHKKDNKSILFLQGHETENEWPISHIVKENLTCWNTKMADAIKTDIGDSWKRYEDISATFYGKAGDLQKNPLAIARTLESAWTCDKKSKLLIDLTDRIIEFAKGATTTQ